MFYYFYTLEILINMCIYAFHLFFSSLMTVLIALQNEFTSKFNIIISANFLDISSKTRCFQQLITVSILYAVHVLFSLLLRYMSPMLCHAINLQSKERLNT